MSKPTGVVVDNASQRGALITYLKHFVDLFLIFNDRNAHRGILQYVHHLLGDRVLIQRDRHPAQRLGRHHAHIQLRPVLTNHGDMITLFDPKRRQATSKFLDPVVYLLPSQRLPDAQVLLAQGWSMAANTCVLNQEGGKSRRLSHRRVLHDRLCAPF